jgi:hypothetical protein
MGLTDNKKLCEVYKVRDTHIMNEMIKYTKKLNEKEKGNPKLVVKDKHIIIDSYVNSEY